jgi:hypothetical protein
MHNHTGTENYEYSTQHNADLHKRGRPENRMAIEQVGERAQEQYLSEPHTG